MAILLRWTKYIAAASVFFTMISYAEEQINFSPNKNTIVTIEIIDKSDTESPGIKEVQYRILFNDKVRNGSIRVEALRDLRIDIDDYNFDGVKDFSINYLDDGWGTYEISRIFVFSSLVANFNEVFPNGKDCPGEFMSIRVDKKNRAIISSNYDGLKKGWYQCKSVLPIDSAPSFNCSKTNSVVEKMICADKKLSSLDTLVAMSYSKMKLADIGDKRDQLTTDQRTWLKQRNACKTTQCLDESYRNRLDEFCQKYPVASGQVFECVSSSELPF